MKKSILISLLVGMMGVIAFIGCERETISPNEGQPQRANEDSLINQPQNLIVDSSLGIHGLWKCTEQIGSYYLNFKKTSENTGTVTKENCTLDWRTFFDDRPSYYYCLLDSVMSLPGPLEGFEATKMLRLDTITMTPEGEPVCHDFSVVFHAFDSITLWYTGPLPLTLGPDVPNPIINLKLQSR